MFNYRSGNRVSLLIVYLVSIIILYSHFSLPKYKYKDYTSELTWDAVSYYLYLPMTFIYQDPGMKTPVVDSLKAHYNFSPTLYQIHNTDVGTRVPNYTSGMSYFFAPFFFIGHFWAKNSDYPADGFSYPYHVAIATGIYLFILPGLFLLRKLLIQFFNEATVSISLIILFIGTNYFSEATANYLQPHAVLFFLYTLLLYHTKKWHDSPSHKSAAIIGVCIGWITLTRPTDIICILIPMLWGIHDKDTLNWKIKLLRINFKHVLLLAIMGIVPFIPQFIYWKITTGSFIYYSYKHTEGFDFLAPHIWDVLFSFKKSLFVYTPLLIIPLIGLFLLPKRLPKQKYFVILFTILNFYLLSSWAVWWNGSSLGMRYFVQSYSILAIPLCIGVERILKLNYWKYLIFAAISFLIFLNLFQTWQLVNWILPGDQMNYKYYKAIFLKKSVSKEDIKLMETYRNPSSTETFDNENEYNHYTLAYYNFEDVNASPVEDWAISKKYSLSPPNSCRLSPENTYCPTFKIKYENLVKENLDHVWLRVTVNYYSDIDIFKNPASLVINYRHNDFFAKYREFVLEKYKFEKGKWNTLTVDYMSPFPYSGKDLFEIYMWYRGNSELFIDNLKVEVYEKKDDIKPMQ